MITLDILIPTYNRCEFLKKNVNNLLSQLDGTNVNIIISNNASKDKTQDYLFEIQNYERVTVFNQRENIGLQANFIFLMEASNADYVMLLGDDDFLDNKYLIEVQNLIKNVKPHCIIGNTMSVDEYNNPLGYIRDNKRGTLKFSRGTYSALRLNKFASQMSGLVFKRSGIVDSFRNHQVNNLYPQIYFSIHSIELGDCFYITDYPTRITQVIQDKKDWSYTKDLLLGEKFDNYKAYYGKRSMLRVIFELWMLSQPSKALIETLVRKPYDLLSYIYFSDKWSSVTKLCLPFCLVFSIILGVYGKIRKSIVRIM